MPSASSDAICNVPEQCQNYLLLVRTCVFNKSKNQRSWGLVCRLPSGELAGFDTYSISQEICTRFLLCCALLWLYIDFPISIRLTSLALWQSDDCPSASKATLMNMDKYVIWIHYERLHNHNKAKHNKTVCIFLGIYCNPRIIAECCTTQAGRPGISTQFVSAGLLLLYRYIFCLQKLIYYIHIYIYIYVCV